MANLKAEIVQRDYEELLAEALRQPGVAELMALYEAVEKAGDAVPVTEYSLYSATSTSTSPVVRRR